MASAARSPPELAQQCLAAGACLAAAGAVLVARAAVQMPCSSSRRSPHFLPHELQLCGSLVRSLQPSAQQVWRRRSTRRRRCSGTVRRRSCCRWCTADCTAWAMHLPSMQRVAGRAHACCSRRSAWDRSTDRSSRRRRSEPPGQQIWLPVQLLPPLQLQLPPWCTARPSCTMWLHEPQLVALCVTQVAAAAELAGGAGDVAAQALAAAADLAGAAALAAHAAVAADRWSVLAQPVVQQVSPAAQMAPLHAQAPPAQLSGVVQACRRCRSCALSLLGRRRPSRSRRRGSCTWRRWCRRCRLPVVEQVPSAQQTAMRAGAGGAGGAADALAGAAAIRPGCTRGRSSPQWNGSVCRSTQPTPEQQVLPPLHGRAAGAAAGGARAAVAAGGAGDAAAAAVGGVVLHADARCRRSRPSWRRRTAPPHR